MWSLYRFPDVRSSATVHIPNVPTYYKAVAIAVPGPNAPTLFFKAVAIAVPAANWVGITDNWPNAVAVLAANWVGVPDNWPNAVAVHYAHNEAVMGAFESPPDESGSCGPEWDR